MAKKDRIGWVNSRWGLFDRIWPIVASAIGGGILTGLTDFMAAFAPLSWALGAAVTVLLWLAGSLLFEANRTRRLKNRRFQELEAPKSQINPLDAVFERKRIWISDLITPLDPKVRNRTFIDCEFIGPGIIAYQGNTTIEHCEFMGCDMVVLRIPSVVNNATIFVDCAFRRCRIVHGTVLIAEPLYAQVNLPGANWITHTPNGA